MVVHSKFKQADGANTMSPSKEATTPGWDEFVRLHGECHRRAVDSCLLEIETPAKDDAGCSSKSFYSRHTQKLRANIQAASNHHCHFTYMDVAGPGVMGGQGSTNRSFLGEVH